MYQDLSMYSDYWAYNAPGWKPKEYCNIALDLIEKEIKGAKL